MIRVLYIDDESALLTLTQIYLREEASLNVEIASSAIEGLNLLKTNAYDAIISDYDMPDMDGIEFLKQVREFDLAIPFIIFTGKGREEVAIEALNNGADFYIQKGGDPHSLFTELANAIRHLVRRSHAERNAIQSEQHLRAFLNALPDLAFIKGPDLRLLHINAAFQNYLNLSSADDANGRFHGDLLPEIFLPIMKSSDSIIIEQNIPVTSQISTEGRVFEIQKFPLPFPDGQTGIGGIIRDISHVQTGL